jgi:repressor LexA
MCFYFVNTFLKKFLKKFYFCEQVCYNVNIGGKETMLSKEQLGAYLKSIRDNKGISLRTVDEKTGISYTHLNMVENGKRNVTPALLRNLANFYGVDYLDLYEKAGYIDLIENEKIDKNITGMGSKAEGSAVVMVYGTIPAGVPMEMIEDILDTEEIPADMVKGGKQYFGLRIKGNSMYPEYIDGDTIILEKIDDCESGQDCCVMVNGNDRDFQKSIQK